VVKLEGLLKRLVERLVGDFTIATYNHPRYSNMAFLWALEKIRQGAFGDSYAARSRS
jgi:hypothetical protein